MLIDTLECSPKIAEVCFSLGDFYHDLSRYDAKSCEAIAWLMFEKLKIKKPSLKRFERFDIYMYLAYERWICGLYKEVVKMPSIDYKIFCFLASEITKWLKNEFIPSAMLREILKDFVYDDRSWQLVMRDVSWARFDDDFDMYGECFDYGSMWFSFKFCDDLQNALKDVASQIYYSKDGEARSRIMWELGDSWRDNWGIFEWVRVGKFMQSINAIMTVRYL